MMPTAADDTNVSPWERFYQRELDYSKNLKAGFGEYCQCHDNASDNTLTSRTTGGLTVYQCMIQELKMDLGIFIT